MARWTTDTGGSTSCGIHEWHGTRAPVPCPHCLVAAELNTDALVGVVAKAKAQPPHEVKPESVPSWGNRKRDLTKRA